MLDHCGNNTKMYPDLAILVYFEGNSLPIDELKLLLWDKSIYS